MGHPSFGMYIMGTCLQLASEHVAEIGERDLSLAT